MELAEIRKGLVAVLGAVVTIVPQVLLTFGGLIPADAAAGLSILAVVATAALVYLVPNKVPLVDKTASAIEILRPAVDEIEQRLTRAAVASVSTNYPEETPAPVVDTSRPEDWAPEQGR